MLALYCYNKTQFNSASCVPTLFVDSTIFWWTGCDFSGKLIDEIFLAVSYLYGHIIDTTFVSWREAELTFNNPIFYWRNSAIDPSHKFSRTRQFSLYTWSCQLVSCRIDNPVPSSRRKMIITTTEGLVFCSGILSTIWITEGFVFITFLMCYERDKKTS